MSRKRRLLLLQFSTAGIILAMMLIFFPPYATAFVGDDYVQLDYVLEFVKRPFSLFEVFNPYWTGWYYRPLQNVWFFLNRTLFGYNPFGYYWMGLLAHGMAVAMMVAVARKMGLRWETAVTCGVLFAIQKHYVDIVTWISAIAIVLAGLFSMAALAAYTKYLRKGNGRDLALTFLFFLLTLFSHEEAFFLPPLLLLWHFLFNSKKAADGKRILLSISPGQWAFWGVSAALLGSYLYFQITRTNLTISVQDTVAVGGWQLLTPLPLSQFITDTVGKFVPIPGLATWLMPYSYGVAFFGSGAAGGLVLAREQAGAAGHRLGGAAFSIYLRGAVGEQARALCGTAHLSGLDWACAGFRSRHRGFAAEFEDSQKTQGKRPFLDQCDWPRHSSWAHQQRQLRAPGASELVGRHGGRGFSAPPTASAAA